MTVRFDYRNCHFQDNGFAGGQRALFMFQCLAIEVLLARIIHDGSSRNLAVAKRDRRAESRRREAYLNQYVDRPS